MILKKNAVRTFGDSYKSSHEFQNITFKSIFSIKYDEGKGGIILMESKSSFSCLLKNITFSFIVTRI